MCPTLFCISHSHRRKYTEYELRTYVRKIKLNRSEIKYKAKKIFSQRTFDHGFTAERYRFLIFSGFVHSKFGCRANTFFVHFTWSEMWSHASTSIYSHIPKGHQVKNQTKMLITFKQETLDTSILASIVTYSL